MKRRQFQRSPAEYGSGAARTPRLLHRMRDAAFARRSAHRTGDAAMDTVPAIEDQLHMLRLICSAQRVSTGFTCGAPAVAVAEIHAIDGCDQMGLSPHGDLVETLRQNNTNHPGESVRRVMTADPASVDSGQQMECGGLIGADDVPDPCSKPLDRAAGGGTRRDALPAGAANTVFTGEVKDHSQLYGLLDRLRDLGLRLISVQPQTGAGRETDEDQNEGVLSSERKATLAARLV